MRTGQVEPVDTATQILDVAEGFVHVRGFNGISYADVAVELKITKAALHYHFPGKAQLGQALIERYATRFSEALAAEEAPTPDVSARLCVYVDLYLDKLRDQRMCLCGVMAAEYASLPKQMQNTVVRFFEANESWLTGVLNQGRESGTLDFVGSSGEMAQLIMSGLQGAMLVTRPLRKISHFQGVADRMLASLRPRSTEAEQD